VTSAWVHRVLLRLLLGLLLLWPLGAEAGGRTWQSPAPDLSLGGTGYSPVPLQTTQVTLVTQQVDIYLSPASSDVRTRLTLHNPAAETVLVVGFPQDQPRPSSGPAAAQLEDMQATIDGQPLAISFERYIDPMLAPDFGGWHTVQLPFDAGQTRQLEGRYRARNSVGARDEAYVQYVLSPSAIWPGPIDAITVTVHLTDTVTWDQLLGVSDGGSSSAGDDLPVGIAPAGYDRVGNQLRWHWYGVEPDPSYNLLLAFYRRPGRVFGQAETLLAPREPEPPPVEPRNSMSGWAPLGLILLVVLVLAALVGRRRGDPLRLDT
jgi:hypothetical protein